MSGSASIAASSRGRFDLREPAIVFGAFLAASWIAPLLPRPVLLQSILGAAAVLFLAWSIYRRGEDPRGLGIRADNLPLATAVFLIATAGLAAPALWWGDAIRFASEEVFRYFLWALFQQFLVVAGFWRNFRGSAFLAAVAFSMAHAPNLPLMGLTVVAETVWLRIFRRFPNLASLALAHALAALIVSHALVPGSIPNLRVGLGYFR